MTELLKGAPVGAAITENLKDEVLKLKEKGVEPCLEIIRVGENPNDISYEKGLLSRAAKVGVKVKQVVFDSDVSGKEILGEVEHANNDSNVHGILMFRPLKNKEIEKAVCEILNPKKDVDSMTGQSLVKVLTGEGDGFYPCTAEAVLEVIKFYNINLKGANVAVLGRSDVIGKPVSIMLLRENATVTICHSKTADIKSVCRNKDILISCMGRAEMVNEDYTNPNQTIIDVGINVNSEGKLVGDVNQVSVEGKCKALTPVPGGIGAVTSSVLIRHVVEEAKR